MADKNCANGMNDVVELKAKSVGGETGPIASKPVDMSLSEYDGRGDTNPKVNRS